MMGIESTTYPDGLVNTNPVKGTDAGSTLADHIWLLKNMWLNTFPNLNAEVPLTPTEFNLLDGVTGVLTTNAGTQTLTNKTLTTPTLTSPVLNTGVSGTAVLDDDSMATASDTTLATSESIKAYVDAEVTAGAGIAADDYATSTVGGTVKMRVSGGVLYIRNDGTDA